MSITGRAALAVPLLLLLVGAFGQPARPAPSAPSTATATPEPTPQSAPQSAPVPAATRPTAAPTAASSSEPAPAGSTPNKRGVHLLLDDGGHRWPDAVWDEHVDWASRLIGRRGHVVQLIRSDDLRPDRWQPFFDAVARHGLTPIIRLATYKQGDRWWAAPTTDAGGETYNGEGERVRLFLEAIAWRTDRIVVTVANEPNRPDEWGGQPDPAAYARYLRDMASALRRVSAVNVVVLNGALDAFAPSTPIGPSRPGPRPGPADADADADADAEWSIDAEQFLEGMAREVPGLFDGLDGWASHAYPLGPFGEHPARQELRIDDARPDGGPRPSAPGEPPNRGVNGYAWDLWKLKRLGVQKELPIYVTETGWRHASSQAQVSVDAAWAVLGDALYRRYVELALDGPSDGQPDGWVPWNRDQRVITAALFALGGRPERWGHTNLLLLDPSGRVLGAHPAIASPPTPPRDTSP